MTASLPKAFIKHQLAGRVRLKIPAKRGDEQYFEALAEAFATCETISQLQLNPPTASLLIQHGATPFSDIAEFAEIAGLFVLAEEEYADLPAIEHLSVASLSSLGVSHVDKQLKRLSEGRVDLRSAFFLGFMGLAIHQAAKGRIMSPASTFFWRAVELLNNKNEKMF
jgi:hypothetical protein